MDFHVVCCVSVFDHDFEGLIGISNCLKMDALEIFLFLLFRTFFLTIATIAAKMFACLQPERCHRCSVEMFLLMVCFLVAAVCPLMFFEMACGRAVHHKHADLDVAIWCFPTFLNQRRELEEMIGHSR